ncbi:MAG: glycoside hydrolase family 130 protein [Clostridia bacterium]|nr:glycoside hydrolase family 130 protein [Clostridia bacterium]
MNYEPMLPPLKSSGVIKKRGIILSKKDIPYKADCIFNAGVAKYKGRYVMIFRNDYGHRGSWVFEGCSLGIAFSDDGISWSVESEPFMTLEKLGIRECKRIYDPRLTVIEDKLFICFAFDTEHGIRGGVGSVREDFSGIDILSLSSPDNRNMVLFPEKTDGKYVRLERPFTIYSRGGKDRFDLWISKSPDLKYWGEENLLLAVENVPYANDKIGPGAPPVRTDKGWLTLFHAVDIDNTRGKHGWEDKWTKRYSAGIMLLDLRNPERVIGVSKLPLIAPEEEYETEEGFRTNVVFPGGMILEDNGEVKIYYGASDTFECLATADVNDLINLCISEK